MAERILVSPGELWVLVVLVSSVVTVRVAAVSYTNDDVCNDGD